MGSARLRRGRRDDSALLACWASFRCCVCRGDARICAAAAGVSFCLASFLFFFSLSSFFFSLPSLADWQENESSQMVAPIPGAPGRMLIFRRGERRSAAHHPRHTSTSHSSAEQKSSASRRPAAAACAFASGAGCASNPSRAFEAVGSRRAKTRGIGRGARDGERERRGTYGQRGFSTVQHAQGDPFFLLLTRGTVSLTRPANQRVGRLRTGVQMLSARPLVLTGPRVKESSRWSGEVGVGSRKVLVQVPSETGAEAAR